MLITWNRVLIVEWEAVLQILDTGFPYYLKAECSYENFH